MAVYFAEAKGTIGKGARGRLSRPQGYKSWEFKINQVVIDGVRKKPVDFVLKCSWKRDYFPQGSVGQITGCVSPYNLKLEEAPLCYFKVETILTVQQVTMPWLEFEFMDVPTFFLRPILSPESSFEETKFSVLFSFRGLR